MHKFSSRFPALLILTTWLLVGCTSGQAISLPWGGEPTATISPAQSSSLQNQPEVISAEGVVVPARYVFLSFGTAGSLVEEVFFKEGDTIKSGETIARLSDRARIEAAVTNAETQLLAAQQDLDTLYDNTELASAQARQTVIEAEDAVHDAERVVNALQNPATPSQISTAKSALELATSAYDRAQKQLENVEKRNASDAVKLAAQLALYAAEQQFYRAQSYLNVLQGEPTPEDIERAEVTLELANAQLNEAEKQYEILKIGPDPDHVKLAEAKIKNAQAQLVSALESLDKLDLRAPFDGTIVSLEIKAGQAVDPTIPAVVLADLKNWLVETTDLQEGDLGYIEVGMPALINLDAFPDEEFQGTVQKIDLLGKEIRGAANYTVTIDFDPEETPVRWLMTAFVDFLR